MKPGRGREKYSFQMAAHPTRLSVCRKKNISLPLFILVQEERIFFLRLFSFFVDAKLAIQLEAPRMRCV